MSTKTVSKWTDELFEEMQAAYIAKMEELEEEDRPKHSAEIVAEIAEQYGFAVNSFRMKLSKAGSYIKKEAGSTSKASSTEKAAGSTTRVSKADAHNDLVAAFTDGGVAVGDIDMSIIEKLTGKAAAHLSALVRQITK
jgi:hypothetical protein